MISKFSKRIDKTLIMFFIIAIAGFSIRLYDLAKSPLDFDESIHAFTSFLLFKEGIYNYNPNAHGPFLYYFTAGIFRVLGDNIFSARLLPALFGGSMVLLLLPLRKYLGDTKFLLISGMMAFSYSFIIFSRQLRHDIFLAFFILSFIVCMILFMERHSPLYLYLGFVNLAITTAIKPTTFIFMFILVYFLILNKNQILDSTTGNYFKKNKIYSSIIYIALIFLVINYLFYANLTDGFARAIYNWIYQIYSPDINQKQILYQPYYYYLSNLLNFDFFIFITGLIGCIYYFIKKEKDYFIIFCSFWAIVSLLIFSTIKYKTPDLILNILLPFIIVSGFFLGDLIERFSNNNRFVLSSIIILMLALMIFVHSPLISKNDNDYDKITQLINENESKKKDIYFISPLGNFFGMDWPLPWYLRGNNLFQSDNNGHVIELNYLFDPKYSDTAQNFVHLKRTKGIVITSINETSMVKNGYNNTKHFENSGIYLYY